jgi:hypothetical protein
MGSNKYERAWCGVVVKWLLVGRSRDRFPVVSHGIFSVASDSSMCPRSTQALKMSIRVLLRVKTAGTYACHPTTFKCRCHGIWKP